MFEVYFCLQMARAGGRKFTGCAQDYLDWFKGTEFDKVKNVQLAIFDTGYDKSWTNVCCYMANEIMITLI